MKVIYCADDGTEFNTEAECLKYEKRISDLIDEHKHNGFQVYDDDGEEIEFSRYSPECLEDAFQDISYIKFNRQKAIDIFSAQAYDIGMCDIAEDICRPIEVGERYFYDWGEEKWMCLEDKQRELNEIARIFESDSYD